MAITFVQQKRRQQYLILVFAALMLIILSVVWWGFFRKQTEEAPPPMPEPVRQPLPEIDFKALESPFLQQAEDFPEVPPFIATGDLQAGRENPFVPY